MFSSAAGGALVFAAAIAACTSFEATPGGVGDDGGSSDAPAATNEAGSGACVGATALAVDAACAPGGCNPQQLYPAAGNVRATVRGEYIYGATTTDIRRAKLPSGVFESFVGIPASDVQALATDDRFLYVSSATSHFRYTLAEPPTNAPLAALVTRPGILAVGGSVVFVLAPKQISRIEKVEGPGNVDDANIDDGTALAVAGDDAFWISRSGSTKQPIVAGPFPKTAAIAESALVGPVAIAATTTHLFVALSEGRGKGSRIVRVDRAAPNAVAPLAVESGDIRYLAIHDAALYWIADRSNDQASLVAARYDLCTGKATLLGLRLTDVTTLSFDAAFAYAFTGGPPQDSVYRFPLPSP